MTALQQINLVPMERPTRASRVAKRTMDLLVGGMLLLAAALPMLLIALAIKIADRGPVFYSQRRLTRHGREFSMLKFRSMRVHAEPDGAVFAKESDPRCTRLGHLLRRTGLDELPQLFNVLRGDMSLVGPRPERPELMPAIIRQLPAYPQRLQSKAGITGWAQVHGLRGNTSFSARLEHDLWYQQHQSLMLDMRILLMTVALLFSLAWKRKA